MRLIVSLFMIFIIVGFSGCSSKKIEPSNKMFLSESSSEDEELDDFEDEFEVKEIYDPFSGYNRAMTSFNDNAYEYILKPIANGYSYIFHEKIRLSIDKFFHNIYFPVRFVNNLLQGKFYNVYEESGRFVINSTIGFLGLFDPAQSKFNLQAHNEDFGQTLGFYGVGGGPHIVIPLLGPSNLRDTISLYPDSLVSMINLTKRSYWTLTDTTAEFIAIKSLEKINTTSLYMSEYDKLKADAVDLYPYLRDVYEQHRDKLIEE